MIRAGYGMFYGGEENQGGSPNRGEGVPFNETVNLTRANGVSSFIGVSEPKCTGCNYMPGGLTGGYPAQRRSRCLPPYPFRGVQTELPQSAGAEVELHGAARTARANGPGSRLRRQSLRRIR